MPPVRIRDGKPNNERFPLSRFPVSVIRSLAKHVVHLEVTGHKDMTGEQFSRFFASSIGGKSLDRPLGIVDVGWKSCGWSVKTVKNAKPFACRKLRLISGRNSPDYSAGIKDPHAIIKMTGAAVLEIYNERVNTANKEYEELRMLVLVRNMESGEFTLFERPIQKFGVDNYVWKENARGNLEGFEGERHCFTWQPHGSQFTIIEPVPAGVTKFRIRRDIPVLPMKQALEWAGFEPEWVEISK